MAGAPICRAGPDTPIKDLYYLDLPQAGQGGIEAPPVLSFPEALEEVGPDLNLSSTVYYVGQGRLADIPRVESALTSLGGFLLRHPFLQVSFRPVHALTDEHLEPWKDAYRRLAQRCSGFQEEGYREQIVPRLRVFPVLFVSGEAGSERVMPLLDWLNRHFLLPAIACPRKASARVFSAMAAGSLPPWERVFFTDTREFSPEALLEPLCGNSLLDLLLGQDPEARLGEAPLCRGQLILDSRGFGRKCRAEASAPMPLLSGAGEGPGRAREAAHAAHPERPSCYSCAYRALQRSRDEFRLNERLEPWSRLALRVARELRLAGERQPAIDLLQGCADSFADHGVSLDVRFEKALCHYEGGELEPAMAELSLARQAAPESAEIRYYLGLCEFSWRDYIEAADRFREALELGLSAPLRCEAEYFRGESHFHLEEFDEALTALGRAEREGKGGSPVTFYQGLSWLGKKRPQEACPFLEEALARGPSAEDLFSVLFYLAHAWKEKGDYATSLGYCRRALAVQPASQELQNLMGFCHFQRREYDTAICCFAKALEIDPSSAIDLANLGSCLREKGDFEGAAKTYRRALALDPAIDFAIESLKKIEARLAAEKKPPTGNGSSGTQT